MPLVVMMPPASSRWLCSGSCQQNWGQSHRLSQMKRMGEDLIMILLVIYFAPSITIEIILSELLPISDPSVVDIVIVIMQQYVTTIQNSLLLRTPGQHSYMKMEDTTQTVLAMVYSRVRYSSGCVGLLSPS